MKIIENEKGNFSELIFDETKDLFTINEKRILRKLSSKYQLLESFTDITQFETLKSLIDKKMVIVKTLVEGINFYSLAKKHDDGCLYDLLRLLSAEASERERDESIINTTPEKAKAVYSMVLKFSSGNLIPVDRAMITREEVEAIFGFRVGRTNIDIINNPLK